MTSPLKDFARRVRRMGRALVGKDLWLTPQVRVDHVRLGSEYGGWWVVPSLIRPESVVYSFGVGDDISWDLAMVQRFGVCVHAFDPTPRCLEWIRGQQLPDRLRFHPLGLADFDGEAQFAMHNPDPLWNAYNLTKGGEDARGAHEIVRCQVRTLATIAKDLGHERVDILKMDIEGAEYGALKNILAGTFRPAQLLIEYHYFEGPGSRVQETADSIRSLQDAGYRLFARSPVGHEFAFVRV